VDLILVWRVLFLELQLKPFLKRRARTPPIDHRFVLPRKARRRRRTMTMNVTMTREVEVAVLDEAHVGHINGAFGTILYGDIAPRTTWKQRLTTLLAILGPGLIVMVGDNDAGAFATYGQSGQNYGTSLMWTLALLIPVLYVNQEMVLRLGAVTGVGHARLIFERFGKFWGSFSVIDLFLLNALTIITEFIGIALALDYLGLDKTTGVIISATLIMVAVSTGNFRRFERFAMVLVFASLLLVPIYFMAHPPFAQVVHDFVIPQMPAGSKLSDAVLLIIGIVGTTVAPWQLFFQQSYVIDKRITPRFIRYERLDLWIGIAMVIIGGAAIMAFTAATFAGQREFGNFTDAGGIATGIDKYVGKTAGVMFAFALIDAALIGASAVSLATAYAIGDVFSARHSLHRKVSDAKSFYGVYFLLIAVAAVIVLIPGSPLGLLTLAVQVLAGVLLPSATVFLLLLCNDTPVLGPWVNSRHLNYFTGAVITVLVILSIVLTTSVLFPNATNDQVIFGILAGGGALALTAAFGAWAVSSKAQSPATRAVINGAADATAMARSTWRMPPLEQLAPAKLSLAAKTWMGVLRVYLVVAVVLVLFRIVVLALGGS
jgi:Mn2+/Fe2+ NRAMP family transporter